MYSNDCLTLTTEQRACGKHGGGGGRGGGKGGATAMTCRAHCPLQVEGLAVGAAAAGTMVACWELLVSHHCLESHPPIGPL